MADFGDAGNDIEEYFADSESEEEDFGIDLEQLNDAGIGPGTLGNAQDSDSDSAVSSDEEDLVVGGRRQQVRPNRNEADTILPRNWEENY